MFRLRRTPLAVAGAALLFLLGSAVVARSAVAGAGSDVGSGGGYARAGRVPGSARPLVPMAAPPGYAVRGIDVSAHDHDPGKPPLVWSDQANAGIKFAYVKATEATSYVNAYYGSDVSAAKGVGMYVGAYAYGRPDLGNPVGQADYFVDHMQWSRDGRTLPPFLDMEWPYFGGVNSCYNLSATQMVAWIGAFLSELQARTGVTPMIYTNVNWWNPCTGNSASFGNYLLDISSCTSSPPSVPGWGSRWTFWQYDIPDCDSSIIHDYDVFHDDLAALAALAGGGYARGDHVYGLSPDRAHVSVWNGSGSGPGAWTVIGDATGHIWAGGAGLFATNPDGSVVSRYNGSGSGPGAWTPIGGPGAEFAVSGDHFYGLAPDRSGVYVWTGNPNQWAQIGGPAAHIWAGGAGLVATNPDGSVVSRYNGSGSGPGAWTPIGGPGDSYAVGSTRIYGLATGKSAVSVYSGSGSGPGAWTPIGGPADSIAAGA
jgi:GH25 family lysozyme M1 (1,4-beta-N-acetylmuramidase)